MERFHEVLREVRQQSHYRHATNFARHARLSTRMYHYYEEGVLVPSQEILGRIIGIMSISTETQEKLYILHRLALAEKSGVDLSIFEQPVDLSDLAEKIGKEVGYELKRYNINLTPRIRRVCVRRIAMILDGALRNK